MTKETREKDKRIFEISLRIILIHPQLPDYTISNKISYKRQLLILFKKNHFF